MARAHAARGESSTTSAAGPGAVIGDSPVRISSIALRELTYRELEFEAEKLRVTEPRMNIGLQMQGQIRFLDAHHAELLLKISAKPDPVIKPIELFVAMSGVFERMPPLGPRAFAAFVSSSGPRILFPYLREAISTISNRGLFGAVHLDPVSVNPLLTDEQLAKIPLTD